jgi:hypothetical protein
MKASVTRNKLGRSGQTAKWKTVIEASGEPLPALRATLSLKEEGKRL